ncbi:hypothetical protein [Lampropedia aestuarii]|uniref:hypothetical protein n=1 Tax=Lampropedia aestuarii TaxID=2562762 RepID=UPI0024687768|nr:hypothetical protein [Lampropedia aestuarii]MDH5856436.1 hypothetical protein [Lampropedia aestuarii]
MPGNYPLIPRICESTAEFLMGDLQTPTASYRCRRQRPLTEGERNMAFQIFSHSIIYSQVRIIQESYLPFNMQGKRVAMAPNGMIYMPAYGELYSNDYSSSSMQRQHIFMHEMSHVWQHQSGMAVFIRGMVSGLVSYKYELDFGSPVQKSLMNYRMEQQASIIADYWFLLNYGGVGEWFYMNKIKNYGNQKSEYLIPLYESI